MSGLGEAARVASLSCDGLSSEEAIMVPVFCCLLLRAFKVSLLDCFLGRPRETRRASVLCRLALGVWLPGYPDQAASSLESEPLNEEFSLSPAPSLSQWRFSKSLSPAVC